MDQRLRNLVMTYGRKAWGTTNNHVAGSAFIIAYLTRLVWPVIGQYVLQRRVPKVSLDNVAFHCNTEGIDATALNHPWFAVLPGDPAVDHPDSEGVAGKADLYGRLEEWMFDSNLTPVIDALHRAAGASIKVSQNAVANSCTQAFHWLYSASKDPSPIVREASTFFDEQDSPVYGQVSMEVFEHLGKQGFFSRRSGMAHGKGPRLLFQLHPDIQGSTGPAIPRPARARRVELGILNDLFKMLAARLGGAA